MSVKIQINSKEALDRLIEGDPELKIQVRESIINGFAKTYLKSVANSKVMETLETEIMEELRDTGFFGLLEEECSGVIRKMKLSSDVRELIKSKVTHSVHTLINEAMKKPTNDIKTLLKERFDYLAWVVESKLSEDIAKGILEEMVRKRLMDSLNIENCNTNNP